ncbi:hypothetical protein D3C87_1807350 [compost metagenome]
MLASPVDRIYALLDQSEDGDEDVFFVLNQGWIDDPQNFDALAGLVGRLAKQRKPLVFLLKPLSEAK